MRTYQATVAIISDNAIRVYFGDDKAPGRACWLPKSQIDIMSSGYFDEGDQIEFKCPNWLAEREDFSHYAE